VERLVELLRVELLKLHLKRLFPELLAVLFLVQRNMDLVWMRLRLDYWVKEPQQR
jgi:hypothetical protein